MKKIISKYKTMSLPVKAALWFTAANFLIKGISFITVPLFTRYLSTEEYGKVSIYMTYQQILLIFATFEMSLGAYIRGLLKYKQNTKLFTYSEQALSSIITAIIFLLTLPFMKWFISGAEINNTVYFMMFIYFLVFPSYQCWINGKRFNYKYQPVVIMSVVYAVSITVIPLFAVINISHTAIIRIEFMLGTEILICLPFYIKNIHPRQLLKNRSLVKEQWKFIILFQAPSIVHSLSYLVLAQSDRVMIGRFIGNSEAGIYSVAYSLASVITILNTSVNQVFKPWRYQKMESKSYSEIKKISNIMLLLFGSMIGLWVLIAPEFMKFLFSADYYEAVWTIPPVSMSVFFMFLYSMFVDIEEYYYKTKYTMYATLICAVFNIAMNYYGMKLYGYMACAYSTLFCYVLFAILHGFWANKAAKPAKVKINQIFDLKFIIVISVLLLSAEIAFTVFYKYTLIRYLIFIVILTVIVFNFNKIKKMFTDLKRAKS